MNFSRGLAKSGLARCGRSTLVRFVIISCCLLLACASAFVASTAAQTLTIITVDGHSTALTAAQITNASHATVTADDHGVVAKFEGVPLSAVLAMAGVQLGDTMRGPRMTEVLLVSAADQYKVAFALAEVDPAFANREIILADKRDGKPLDTKEGPFRVVAPGDKRPARWIRQVTEMKVLAVK